MEGMAIVTFHLRGSGYGYFPLEMRSLSLLAMVLYVAGYLPLTQLDAGVIIGLKVRFKGSGVRFSTVSIRRLRAKGCIDVYP